MPDEEAFEKSFKRPRDYFRRSQREQWEIDRRLGILDWNCADLTPEQCMRFQKHYL